MAREGLLPLIGAESTGETWRAVCVARRKKRVTEAVVRRRIDRKRSFVCLSVAQPGTQGRFARQRKKPWSGGVARELRNFPVEPRNAGDPPQAGANLGQKSFWMLL